MIQNDVPIIGTYGVNGRGSGDMYYKGGNMLHTMRHMLDDDEKWRGVLRGLNEEFWHATVTTQEFEAYMSRECGFDFSKVFDQYLRTTKIPVLAYGEKDGRPAVWFEDVVEGFRVPVDVVVNGKPRRIVVGDEASALEVDGELESFELDRNFYMVLEAR